MTALRERSHSREGGTQRGTSPLLVSASEVKTALGAYAGFDTLPPDVSYRNSILARTDRAEAVHQTLFGIETGRDPRLPPYVYLDQHGHPYARFVTRTARAKAEATLGHARLHLACALIQHGHEGPLPPVIANDSGWTFYNPKTGLKEAYGKVGSDPATIHEAAQRLTDIHANGRTPSQVRSETGTAILTSPQTGALIHTTLSLGNMRPQPHLVKTLERIMTAHPKATAGISFEDLLAAHLTDMHKMYYVVRLAGIRHEGVWYPLEPVITLEKRGAQRIRNLIQRGDIQQVLAWANGFSRGVSKERLLQAIEPGIEVDQTTQIATLRSV